LLRMPCSKAWTTKDIPDLKGKVALVTGATGGLGYETALELAGAGAEVLVGGRNEAKGKEATTKILEAHPQANVVFALIDHGSLASVRKFADDFNAKGKEIDILVNNAGIMAPPTKQTTSDGFEIQFGTNHLSHFALTGLLLPSLKRSPSPRVVNVSSLAARTGKIHFDDLNWEKSYTPWGAYDQSKLSNLVFTFELQRRSDANGWNITAVAAHPGISSTELVKNGPGETSWTGRFIKGLMYPFVSQVPEKGVLSQLFAATAPEAEKGGYYGPNGFYEMKGDVCPAKVPAQAKDLDQAKRFWEESEKLTNVQW